MLEAIGVNFKIKFPILSGSKATALPLETCSSMLEAEIVALSGIGAECLHSALPPPESCRSSRRENPYSYRSVLSKAGSEKHSDAP